tara:strand:- start:12623 stop:12784 length:162 start_codon:yes stop_codon:yes gene_type:complete
MKNDNPYFNGRTPPSLIVKYPEKALPEVYQRVNVIGQWQIINDIAIVFKKFRG